MPKYRCIKTCFVNSTYYTVNKVYELPPKFKHKYLVPVAAAPPVVEREQKVAKPDGLDYMRMTETQLVNMDYPLGDLREILKEQFQIDLAGNTARATVIKKFVEARELSRK